MPIYSFQRKEMKFLLTKAQMEALLPHLSQYMYPDDYCKNGTDYCIYNIYFDTDDNYLIRTSLSKPNHKEKLRVRSYSSPATPEDIVFLELKKKTDGIVHKRRVAMTLREAQEFIESGKRPEISKYMQEQVINELLFFLKQHAVHPVTYISYKRMAFFGKDDYSFRITFDSNITTRRTDLTLEKSSYGEQLLQPEQCLMEIKFSHAIPFWLAELLSEQKLYNTSFSKYGTEYKNFCLNQKVNRRYLVFQPESVLIPA